MRAVLTTLATASLLLSSSTGMAANTVTVADASLSAYFYADSSCLLTIDSLAQAGKTIIDADVDDQGSRMLIHCDTDSGRRLTLLARGDALNVSQRVPLLTREEIEEGELGMIAWLTRSGVNYADDSAPRRYVIAGSVLLRKSPPADVAGNALHSERRAFGRIAGLLEPILKSDSTSISESLPLQIDGESGNPADAPSTPDDASSLPETDGTNDAKGSDEVSNSNSEKSTE